MVQGLELALLQLQPVHPKSSRQNRKRAEVRPGPGFTLVHRMSSLSRKSSCRELSRQLRLGYFFFFFRKDKSLETHSAENKTRRRTESTGKNFGDIPKPINLFIWEGRVGLGREEKRLNPVSTFSFQPSFLFIPTAVILPPSGSAHSAAVKQDPEGLAASLRAAVGAWLLMTGGSREKKKMSLGRGL